MIVYVESNFILELAYLQEEHENCERILKLAEGEKIRLVAPAFAIAEPFRLGSDGKDDAWNCIRV